MTLPAKPVGAQPVLRRVHVPDRLWPRFSSVASCAGLLMTELPDASHLVMSQRPPQPAGDITAQEIVILRCIAEGLSNPAIGTLLEMSEDTVKSICSRIYRKLGAYDRAQAAVIAYRRGLLEDHNA